MKDGKPEDLNEYLAARPCRGPFKPGGHYNAAGEWVCFLADEPCFAEQVDHRLTLFHAASDRRIVGYKITSSL
jgi:hypothetical protein